MIAPRLVEIITDSHWINTCLKANRLSVYMTAETTWNRYDDIPVGIASNVNFFVQTTVIEKLYLIQDMPVSVIL